MPQAFLYDFGVYTLLEELEFLEFLERQSEMKKFDIKLFLQTD